MNTLGYDVLVVIDHYLPGRKFGGPVTTVANMMERLGPELRFLVLTRNFDFDGSPYTEITPNHITRTGSVDVLYLDRGRFGLRDLGQYARLSGARVCYLNSFFSPLTFRFLLLHRLGLLKAKVLLAPRGEFASAAYALKNAKKRLYREILARCGMLRGLRFQVSSHHELADLKRVLGSHWEVLVAPDIFVDQPQCLAPRRQGNQFVYLGRLAENKNLSYALELLQHVSVPITLDIYGPQEDPAYWARCQQLIRQLPHHIKANYCGALSHDEVKPTLSRYAALLFPTQGENYGHVIPEALASGTPVIISDQTPWQDLNAAGVGWVLPLSQPAAFIQAVEEVTRRSPVEVKEVTARCLHYALSLAQDPKVLERNHMLFEFPKE